MCGRGGGGGGGEVLKEGRNSRSSTAFVITQAIKCKKWLFQITHSYNYNNNVLLLSALRQMELLKLPTKFRHVFTTDF